MFEFKFGINIDGLARPLDSAAIAAIGKSSVETIEYAPKNFNGDYAGKIRSEAKKMLEDTGKRFVTCHFPFYEPDEDVSATDEPLRQAAVGHLRAQLEEAYFFGAKIIVLHPSREISAEVAHAPRIAALRRSIEELLPAFRTHGMRLAVEWLPRHCLGNSQDELFRIIEGFGDTVGVCLDVNHMMGAYKDLPAIITRFGEKLFTTHLSDYDGVDEKHWVPGKGVIDWAGVINALRAIHYQGPFCYECDWPGETAAEKLPYAEENFRDFFSKF